MDSDIMSGHTIQLKVKKWSQKSFDWARFKGHVIGLDIIHEFENLAKRRFPVLSVHSSGEFT
jgi:hypothetical protein